MIVEYNVLQNLLEAVADTHSDEIGCDDCFEKLGVFVERVVAGRSPEKGMRLVQDHLDRCGDCRDEFEALREILHERCGFIHGLCTRM